MDYPTSLASYNGHSFMAGSQTLTVVDCGPLIVPVPSETRVGVIRRGQHFESLTLKSATGAHTALTLYATPRSGGYAERLRQVNHEVARSVGSIEDRDGPWGIETVATAENGSSLVCISIEGPRWILRSVTALAPGRGLVDTLLLRQILSWSAVRRGDCPHPAGAALPVDLPQGWQSHS